METKYVSFSSNSKHYLIKESEITDRWHSLSHRNVEHLILRNGFQYRATDLKEFTFLDLSDVPVKAFIEVGEPLDF